MNKHLIFLNKKLEQLKIKNMKHHSVENKTKSLFYKQ